MMNYIYLGLSQLQLLNVIFSDPKSNELKKIYTSMHKSDRVNKKKRITNSLQKCTALQYQKNKQEYH